MKKYRVHVNGKTYDVAVEEIGEVVSAAVSGYPGSRDPHPRSPGDTGGRRSHRRAHARERSWPSR